MPAMTPPSSCFAQSTTSALSFVFSSAPNQVPQRRTNSLGFANSDCHSCKSRNRQCGRQRPRCNTCTETGTVCKGYVQRLDWQPGVASRGKMTGKTFTPPKDESLKNDCTEPVLSRSFIFVPDKTTKRRKTLHRIRARHLENEVPATQPPNTKGQEGKHLPNESSAVIAASTAPTDTHSELYQSIGNFFPISLRNAEVLDFFRWRYALIPLTFEVQVNPWHKCLPMAFESPCMMAAVVALGMRYRAQLLNKAEDVKVLELKDTALSAFSSTLHVSHLNAAVVVGTILVLVALDYAESGYSNWSVHFQGAYKVIQAAGGVEIVEHDPALQSQLAMLLWYDVTSALFSRRAPVFPRTYLEALLSWQSKSWSMLALNGFPDELLFEIYDIAQVSSRSTSVEEVSMLERRVWVAQLNAPDEDLSKLLDCWRFALLLYCARVFSTVSANRLQSSYCLAADPSCPLPWFSLWHTASNSSKDDPPSLNDRCRFLAEEIFWLARDLSPTSNIQKQCLIPITLAACELGSDSAQSPFRMMVEDYCRRWSGQSGLRTFNTALYLIKKVWKFADEKPYTENVWWGDAIERLSRSRLEPSKVHQLQDGSTSGKEFLFG